MNKSYFFEYLAKWFAPLVQSVTEFVNGKKQEEVLLHKTMLTEEYSADLKWGGKEINTSVVAADVVSMDSSLPLKKRDSITAASGDVPKIGMKLRKGEKTIKDIQIMQATNVSEQQIASKIFDDVPKGVKGIEVRKEIMFQQALSNGVVLIENGDENTGLGIRADFGYKTEHFLRSHKPWSDSSCTPQDDIDAVFSKVDADGNSIALIMLSKKYFNYFKNSTQGKTIAANFAGLVYTSAANLPVPSKSNFVAALEDFYSCKFQIVDSSFRVEKDGVQKTIKPWAEANVVFLYDSVVGRLVYGDVAEKSNPVPGVVYQSGSQGTLIAKYSKTDPLEEFTTVQALAIPVIDGADSIYVLQADKEAIALDATTLEFTKAANTTGKAVNVTTDADTITAASDEDWATVTVSGKKVTVKVTANDSAPAGERTATVTITDSDGDTATVAIKQATNA